MTRQKSAAFIGAWNLDFGPYTNGDHPRRCDFELQMLQAQISTRAHY